MAEKLGGYFMNEKEKDEKSTLKGIEVAYYYTIICLVVWILIGFFTGQQSRFALILLITQNLVFMVMKSYYKKSIL